MGRKCSIYGRNEECTQILAGKPEGKVLVGRSKSKWENRVTELLLTRIHRTTVCEDVDWIQVAGFCENCNGPSGSTKRKQFLDQLSKRKLFKNIQDYAVNYCKSCPCFKHHDVHVCCGYRG